MLAEFATHTFPPSACSAPMNGVTVWRFDGGLANAHLPLQLAPQHYEAFFCLDGTLTLRRTRQRTELVSAQDILLLSSVGSLQMVQASTGLRGLLVAVDGACAGASLAALSALTGFGPLNTGARGLRGNRSIALGQHHLRQSCAAHTAGAKPLCRVQGAGAALSPEYPRSHRRNAGSGARQ